MDIKGDLKVKRTIYADRRLNQGLRAASITATEALEKDSEYRQLLSASADQDVILPDATALTEGWSVIIEASGAASLDVKTYDDTTPALLKNILAGRTYEITCIDNSDTAGTWFINYLEESDAIPTLRYMTTFDATASWGSAVGGLYTITITAATHGSGTSPMIQVFELSGSDYIYVLPDTIEVLNNGNVEMSIPQHPDLRFAGKIVII